MDVAVLVLLIVIVLEVGWLIVRDDPYLYRLSKRIRKALKDR